MVRVSGARLAHGSLSGIRSRGRASRGSETPRSIISACPWARYPPRRSNYCRLGDVARHACVFTELFDVPLSLIDPAETIIPFCRSTRVLKALPLREVNIMSLTQTPTQNLCVPKSRFVRNIRQPCNFLETVLRVQEDISSKKEASIGGEVDAGGGLRGNDVGRLV